MNEQIPVLIIGGGAAGVVMTAELLRRGIVCRTIDKLPTSHSYSKALTIHARTLEMFERIDEKLLTKFLDRGHPLKGFSFTFKGIDERPVLDFQALDTSFPYVLSHRQDDTERFIREYIKDNFGYEIEWNTQLLEVTQDDHGVTARVSHLDDNERKEIISARYLIACDGIHSLVRKQLSMDYEGDDYTGMVLQNMDVPLSGYPEDRQDWLNFFMTRDRFIMMAQLPGGHHRLLLSDMGEAARPGVTPKAAFQSFIGEHLDNIELGEPLWASKWDIWNRLAGDYRKGNIFLLGDSAHVHSPSGGQGMNCCMQDAHNLAWKLGLVLRGKAKAELLDTYESERQPIAEQVIGGASAIHQIIMGHGVDVENRFELADDPEWLEQAVGKLSGVSYTYRDQVETPAGLTLLDGPIAGDRAPDVYFSDGSNLYRQLRHPGMTLLCVIPKGQETSVRECSALLSTIQSRYGSEISGKVIMADGQETDIDWIRDDDGAFIRKYQLNDSPSLYLIRPDAYVGFCCLLSEQEFLMQYLESFLLQ